jgi:hypothetical protein
MLCRQHTARIYLLFVIHRSFLHLYIYQLSVDASQLMKKFRNLTRAGTNIILEASFYLCFSNFRKENVFILILHDHWHYSHSALL